MPQDRDIKMEQKALDKLLSIAIRSAYLGGVEILKIYEQDFDVDYKEDNSPLTLADQKANDVISMHLQLTGFPILSEEGKSIPYDQRKNWDYYWIVDPLDGTKEFVKRNGDFTVNIALMLESKPVLGVIYVPTEDTMYFGGKEMGSFKVKNYVQSKDQFLEQLQSDENKMPFALADTYTVVASRSHLSQETAEHIDAIKAKHGEVEVLSRGSSLKICMVAEGKAHEYPRFAPTMEWDIAAGHAIAEGAGKQIIDFNSKESVTYNKENLLNNWFIVQ